MRSHTFRLTLEDRQTHRLWFPDEKNDAGRRSHYLTVHFSIADAPRADEIVVVLGGKPAVGLITGLVIGIKTLKTWVTTSIILLPCKGACAAVCRRTRRPSNGHRMELSTSSPHRFL